MCWPPSPRGSRACLSVAALRVTELLRARRRHPAFPTWWACGPPEASPSGPTWRSMPSAVVDRCPGCSKRWAGSLPTRRPRTAASRTTADTSTVRVACPPLWRRRLTALGSISVLTLPADNDTWWVTLYGSAADAPTRRFRDPEVFERVLRACQAPRPLARWRPDRRHALHGQRSRPATELRGRRSARGHRGDDQLEGPGVASIRAMPRTTPAVSIGRCSASNTRSAPLLFDRDTAKSS